MVGKARIDNKYHGTPCRRCSSTERYIKSKACVSCVKDTNKLRLLTEYPEDKTPLIMRSHEVLRMNWHSNSVTI